MTKTDQRLADLIDQRMKQIGYGPTALADAAGVTQQGIAPLRRGEVKRYQRRLTAPVCAALGWSPDSIDLILAGGDPVEVSAPVADECGSRIGELELMMTQLYEAVAEIEVSRAAAAVEANRLMTDLRQRVQALEESVAPR